MTFIKYIKPSITKAFKTTIWVPEGSFQKDHPLCTQEPFKKYDGPVYVPAEVYKLLGPEAVAALKKYNTEDINKIAKKRSIHVTDIADQEPLPPEDTTHEEQHDPHQFDDADDSEIDPIWITSTDNTTKRKT